VPAVKARIRRFTRPERVAHWLLAAAFFAMLLSGGQVPHRWSVTTPAFDVHVGAAVVLVVGLAALTLRGRGVAATARELSRPLDRADRAWLSPRRLLEGRPAPPADRFNAGQKMNARLLAFGLLGLYATGLYLTFVGNVLPGSLHGPFAFLTTVLVGGHIFMAVVNPSTRPALRGMTLGWVDRDWAVHHHPRWVRRVERGPDDPPPGRRPLS
jgi:formate dehydrogenase subunit gamma